MDLSISLILLVAILLLKISTGEAETTDEIGTLFFNSSLQRSGQRNFVCPGESVSYLCVTHGMRLAWLVNGVPLVTFSSEDRAGSSLSCEDELCPEDLRPCFIISGVLNRIVNNPTRANVSYCYSTLVVTPGQLDDRTAELMACPQDNYQPLNVTCEVIGHHNTSEVTQTREPHLFQIAGVPDMPDSQSSTCYYYRSNSSVTVQIGMPSSINTDLDYFKAELFHDGTLLGSNLVKLPETMGKTIEDPTTTIFNNIMLRSTDIGSTGRFYVNLTLFDKCNQHSLQPLTLTCDLKVTVVNPQPPGGTCEYCARDGRTTITINVPDSTDADSDPAALYYLVGLKYDSNTIPMGVIGTTPNDNTRMLEAPTRLRVINATLTTFCDGEEFIIPCIDTNSGVIQEAKLLYSLVLCVTAITTLKSWQ